MRYAEVAVDAPAGSSTYSYSVPEDLLIREGQSVWVPFGSRTARGVVVEVTAKPAHEATRSILVASSDVPSLSHRQIELGRWISNKYLSSLYAALALMLPPGTAREPDVYYEVVDVAPESLPALPARQRDILRHVRESGKLSLKELRRLHGRTTAGQAADALVREGLLRRSEVPRGSRVKARTESLVSLKVDPQECAREMDSLRKSRAWRQAQVLDFLLSSDTPLSQGQLRTGCGASSAVLRALHDRGLVELHEQRVWRDPLASLNVRSLDAPLLTDWQTSVWDSMVANWDDGSPPEFLLFGVTGSGKTEIYLRAVERMLSLGRRAICLVPEIALAAQTVERFTSRFPGRVALIHSGLSPGQQFDEWERVRSGAADVVVGPRSALFAPVDNLGLVVLDEEHEWAYKQDDVAPRYHARAVARELARMSGAALILGSATPDVETFHRAGTGGPHLLELPHRIGGATQLPPVEVVDMRTELRQGNSGLFSNALVSAIGDALTRGEQVLLFLNRRGTATLVQCRRCGHVFTCPRCSVALAHHSARGRLLCHRCGYSAPVPERCPTCRSPRLRFIGVGTQRVVEEVNSLFPHARTIRWDSDVPARVRGESRLHEAVHGGHVDVIVGTQMVAKGLDFPNVTLVGVVSADLGLNVPDYRSGERVFQLLCQAAGRAGRGVKPGRVVVQSYAPENYVIRTAAAHDYRSFFAAEIRYREDAYYPPFCSVVRLVFSHVNEHRCRLEAEKVHAELARRARGGDIRITGPFPAFVRRVRGRYRWHMTVRGSRPGDLIAGLALPQGWTVDVDPASVA